MVIEELEIPLIYLNIYLFIQNCRDWGRDVAYVKFNFWATDDDPR